ncbi:hypothetical protein CAPTEDRAFT_211974 [Capitella teleta]|uniref:tRNA:m(4)X modification enzyme TRM13 n=1 Tax=Capitella teleta TaxID=283909 RepID=R7TP17_CAPTE|nr:hypothetical protein CAPTEDRAFT_211974 [Capitella teleta]|eukprot:ELT93271.1 hypothetical protein CAPTEDRAFT_211974 [Capitella teleta]
MTDPSPQLHKRLKMDDAEGATLTDKETHHSAASANVYDGPKLKAAVEHEVPASHTTCQFFNKKKNRLCRIQKVKGQNFCSDHMEAAGVKDPRKERMPCPYDSKHTCYVHLLEKHKKHCNGRPELRPPYFSENLNCGDLEGANPDDFKITLKDVPIEELLELINKIKSVHEETIKELRSEVLFHPALKEEAEKPTNGLQAQKHIQQQASLVGHMEKQNLLKSNSIFIEFGAGKGGLSHWVQVASQNETNTKFYLVEKSGVRYQKDIYHKGDNQGPSFERLRINIGDLDLGKVEELHASPVGIVGIGKHLCGGATDLMLRCLVETYVKGSQERVSRLEGVVLAYCCHHRCDWKTYVGKSFMRKFDFSARDFHLMTRMTSWAVSRNQFDERKKEKGDKRRQKMDNVEEEKQTTLKYGGLTYEEREKIGYLCKQLIDEGRRFYLQEQNFNAEVIYYTEKERTLENMALIATAKKSS